MRAVLIALATSCVLAVFIAASSRVASAADEQQAGVTGHRMLKFDDDGNKLAKDFLAKTDKEKDLRVTVHGTESGDEIHVTSITAAEAK